jgi:hypothetical protein
MKRLVKLLVVVALGLASASASFAQDRKARAPRAGRAGQWRLIGQLEVGFTADHDEILVRGPFDDFRRVKFAVTGAPVNIDRMVVTYDNGIPDELPVRDRIREGGESRTIDLRGAGKRSIRKIAFWYDTAGVLRGRAKVTIFGMK